MEINLIPDSSVSSAPSGFAAAVQAAANVFDQDFPGNYTVNISYGWGTYDNQPNSSLTNPDSGDFSLGGPVGFTDVSYATLKGWLTANASLSDQMAALASLPASNTALPGDANSFFVSSAEEKAFGVYTGSAGALDGSIGFNVGYANDSDYWETAAFCEIGHALGWMTDYYTGEPTVLDLFRYASAGSYEWTGGQAAYFSIDGGNTDLADFSTSFDYTLFTGVASNDPFNVAGDKIPATALTSLDIEVLNILGFGGAIQTQPISIASLNYVGTGDFNNSADADVVFQNTNGSPTLWLMDGTIANQVTEPNPGPSWVLSASGDFNGDGNSDLVFDNVNGTPAIWLMNGATVIGTATLANPTASWRIVGTGDVTDSGSNESILFQNNNGAPAIWVMNGTTVVNTYALANPGTSWHMIGSGDVFGTGFNNDILWQNVNGTPAIWVMSGGTVVNAFTLPDPTASFRLIGAGDFAGDGHNDSILFQNNNGQPAIWVMNGSTIVSAVALPNPGASWVITGIGNFTGASNGQSDIFFENAGTGQAAVWLMNGTTVSSTAIVATTGTQLAGGSSGYTPYAASQSGLTTAAAGTDLNSILLATNEAPILSITRSA